VLDGSEIHIWLLHWNHNILDVICNSVHGMLVLVNGTVVLGKCAHVVHTLVGVLFCHCQNYCGLVHGGGLLWSIGERFLLHGFHCDRYHAYLLCKLQWQGQKWPENWHLNVFGDRQEVSQCG